MKNTEIEYKFKVENLPSNFDKKYHILQVYFEPKEKYKFYSMFSIDKKEEIEVFRVRKVELGTITKYFLTLKGKGLTQRKEYEKEITKEEANEYIFDYVVSFLEKNRYVLLFDNLKFEFDEYLDKLSTLKTVEVEVSKDEKKIYDKIILSLTKMQIKFQDITLDPRYKNINLAKENIYENSKFDRRMVL